MGVRIVSPVAAFLLLALTGMQAQDAKPRPAALTVSEVLKFVETGLPEDFIIARIKGNGAPFDLNADEIRELRRRGLSDVVIRVMLDPTYVPPPPPPPAPIAPPQPAPAPEPVKKKPVDPVAEKVPPEPGVYYSPEPGSVEFQRLEFKTLAAARQGGRLSRVLTAGLRKGAVVGFVVGQSARVRVKSESPAFYIRLVENAGIEEYLLVQLTPGPNRRELELGSDAAKPVFPAEALKQTQATELDTGLFRVTASTLEPGEYLFFVLGTADEKKGILAKGYEFGVPK